MFVSKSIALTDTAAGSGASRVRMVNAVSAMEGAELSSYGQAASTTATKSAVQFFRWPQHSNLNRTAGAFLTAQNQFVESPSLKWTMDQNWTTGDGPRTLDAGIIGLYVSARTNQLEFAEAAAVTQAVEYFLVAPAAENSTVKINVSCHDIAAIWVAFFSRCRRYRC